MADVRRRLPARGRCSPTCPPATSVFFGGGTPSLLPVDLLVSILVGDRPGVRSRGHGRVQPRDGHARRCWPPTGGAGVNRLSFGVQSMVPHVLAGLGRSHDPARCGRAVRLRPRTPASAASFNLDLIYGGAGESVADWARTLDQVLGPRARPMSAPTPSRSSRAPRWPATPAAIPTTTIRPTSTLLAERALLGRRTGLVRDLQLGPPRSRVPAQPAVLGPGRLPRHRLCRPQPPGRPPVVERPHPRALHPGGGRGPLAGRRLRNVSTAPPEPSRRCS